MTVRAGAHDGAAPPDRFKDAFGGELGDGPAHGLAAYLVTGHQLGFLRDDRAGGVVAPSDRFAQRCGNVAPQGHACLPPDINMSGCIDGAVGAMHPEYIRIYS